MKLKIFTISISFGKICLRAIGDTFFQYVVCDEGRDGLRQEGKWYYSIFGGEVQSFP